MTLITNFIINMVVNCKKEKIILIWQMELVQELG